MIRKFPKARQKGVVLLVALIVLVAMTLAGIALVRSVDTGNLAAGNLAFRQGSALAADEGIQAAIAWLDSGIAGSGLNSDQPNSGYYATNQEALDVTNRNVTVAAVDWDHNNCSGMTGVTNCIKPSNAVEIQENGTVLYSYSYIIHRLCSKPIDFGDGNNSCITYLSADDKSNNRDFVENEKNGRLGGVATPYYRITTRVLGPRNTTSYVQTVIHY